jgi:hypothetical protein
MCARGNGTICYDALGILRADLGQYALSNRVLRTHIRTSYGGICPVQYVETVDKAKKIAVK